MNVELAPGKYVVAVSGGVDSMVLLHVLQALPDLELVVAHFDHGMRSDSHEDAALVASTAKQYGLVCEIGQGLLGPDASEARAREARYAFLHRIMASQGATAIVTAHHQDDLLETAILNLNRGTGRRGLTSLRDRPDIRRPLLPIPKADILVYAERNKVQWREDSTNASLAYARNVVRHRILARATPAQKNWFRSLIDDTERINEEIDSILRTMVATDGLERAWFASLPHDVSREVMAYFLRHHNVIGYDRRMLDRLTVQAKTRPAGKQLDIYDGYRLLITEAALVLQSPETP